MAEHTAAQPRVKAPKMRSLNPVQPTVTRSATRQELELVQLKQYARKMSKCSKEEAIAFLQRAGIMDARGNVKKAYRS